METVFTLLVACLFNLLGFWVGAKIGQATKNGEEVKMPSINPVERIRERKDKKQAEMEQDRIDTIMRNIEGYDGTGRGQEDVPGR